MKFFNGLTILLLNASLAFAGTVYTGEDAEIFKKLKQELKGQGDKLQPSFKLMGDRKVQVDINTPLDAEPKHLREILGNPAKFHTWALTNINERADGKYFVLLNNLSVAPERPTVLRMDFSIEFGLYNERGIVELDMKTSYENRTFKLSGKMLPLPKAHLESMEIDFRAYPAEGEVERFWISFISKVQLKKTFLYQIVYELLPTRLIENQIKERLETLKFNYRHEESKRRSGK